MFSLYSTCIRNIKKSFAKEYSSGIKKEYEEHDLLGVLKKMKQRDIPKFDSIPSLLGKYKCYSNGRFVLGTARVNTRLAVFFIF